MLRLLPTKSSACRSSTLGYLAQPISELSHTGMAVIASSLGGGLTFLGREQIMQNLGYFAPWSRENSWEQRVAIANIRKANTPQVRSKTNSIDFDQQLQIKVDERTEVLLGFRLSHRRQR